MGDALIKTTARLHDAGEPDRQRPMIRIDDRDGQTILTHISDSIELANTVRASIDSGRDNPFRPDGEIYKMTDPIVDYYLLGPSHSRACSPSYAEFHSPTDGKTKSKDKKKSKSKTELQRRIDYDNLGEVPRQEDRSCWRKWFCCCCRCRRNEAKTGQANGFGEAKSQINANIDYYNRNQMATSSSVADDLSTKAKNRGPADSPSGRDSKKLAKKAPATETSRQQSAKVVLLNDQDPNRKPGDGNSETIRTNGAATGGGASVETELKTSASGSRCIVS